MYRGMIESLFTRQKIDSMRPHIQKTVDSLLDAIIANGCEKPIDLVEKFALPVPSYVSLYFPIVKPIISSAENLCLQQ